MKFRFVILIIMSLNALAIKIEVSISKQKLYLKENNEVVKTYTISSSSYGEGSEEGTNHTPLGLHEIKKKIGHEKPIGARFIGRVFTGDIYPIYSKEKILVTDDVIQTRIMWLSGLEEGENLGGNVDTFKRYIYIHGTPEEWRLGQKASHGCIRMSNSDVIELFNIVEEGTEVYINK